MLKGTNHPFFCKTLSPETRMKISESNKTYWSKVKFKRNIKPKTPETLLNLTLSTIGVSVKVLDKKGNLVETFPTITSAAKHFGVSNCTISCIPDKGEFHNFIFEYKLNDTRVWVYDINEELIKVFNTTR